MCAKSTIENAKTCLLHSETVSHDLFLCRLFLGMTENDRWNLAREHRLCFLCLKSSHVTKTCNNSGKERYKKCSLPHHSLLHKQGDTPAKILVGTIATKKSCTKDNSPLIRTMGYLKENQLSRDQMCVMKMKAIARAAGGELVSFFAVIDTGATRTYAPVPWPNSCVILG